MWCLIMTERQPLSQEDVLALFEREFSFIKNRFSVHTIPLREASENNGSVVNCPGVYVFWRRDLGVIKVGKSQSNSKKRALEHIRDNTRNNLFKMKNLANAQETVLILFNIRDKRDVHWLLSLEAFLEWNSYPVIPSGRIG